MATLLVGVNASETLWQISAPIAQDTIYLKVGSEIVAVLSDFTGGTLLPTGATVPSKVRVKRPIGGTTAASHLQGATLIEYADASVFGGVSEVKAARITLNEAQITTLGDGIEVVPSVVGKILLPISATVVTHPIGGGYGSAVGALRLAADNGVLPYLEWPDVAGPPALFSSASKFAVFVPVTTDILDTPPTGLNLGLIISDTAPSSSGGGTMEVIVLYVEING